MGRMARRLTQKDESAGITHFISLQTLKNTALWAKKGNTLKNTFILDSANFPDIPATTFAFTIMANSSRIVEMSFLDNNDHL